MNAAAIAALSISLMAVAAATLSVRAAQPTRPAPPPRGDAPGDFALIGTDFRDPANVLDDFHDAAARADFARYFSHWTPESVFLGTDATERWVGGEFEAFARPHFDAGKGWTYRARERRISTAPGGQTAYFDELLENAKLGTCRGSGVLHLVDGEWKILQYNLSIPIPNDKAAEVAGIIAAPKP